MIRPVLRTLVILVIACLPVDAAAEPIAFKLLPSPSRATFKADAPLETILGTTAAEGVAGTLTVDPAKPQEAAGTVKVDLTTLSSGNRQRDSDMKTKFLEVDKPENRYAVFEIRSIEIAGALVPGQETPAKVKGVLTIKGKPADTVADARVRYIQLSGAQLEEQKRFGLTSDNLKVLATFATTLANHGIPVPQILFLKLSNDIHMEADLTFVR
jgi:polyisoprenoid-binding protein YceI